MELNGTEAWQKITGSQDTKTGRVGLIPVYDGNDWHLYRNTYIIWPGVENAADPAKVEKLRRNALALLEAFPETVPQLEKMGIRIKATLNKPIRTQADVTVWADSIFNSGPASPLPLHIQDALALVYDDFHLLVRGGRHPVWVLPAAPRGSGVLATMDYLTPGSRTRYGPRHDFTKTAFALQMPEAPQHRTGLRRGPGANGDENGAVRPRGRPRKDGLMPGSKEARAADKKRKAQAERERVKRAKLKEKSPHTRVRRPKLATITELPQPEPQPQPEPEAPARRILVRIGKTADGVGS